MKKVIQFVASWLQAIVDVLAGPESHAEVRYAMPCVGAIRCPQAEDVTCNECGFLIDEAKQ